MQSEVHRSGGVYDPRPDLAGLMSWQVKRRFFAASVSSPRESRCANPLAIGSERCGTVLASRSAEREILVILNMSLVSCVIVN